MVILLVPILVLKIKKKSKIKPLKMVLNGAKDFEKIRDYFTDQQNSLTSLNQCFS